MTADELIEALRNPSEQLVEAWSRMCEGRVWRHIDENKDDDDWHGGAALNLRRTILREDKRDIERLASAIEMTIVMDEPLRAKVEDLVTVKSGAKTLRGNKLDTL